MATTLNPQLIERRAFTSSQRTGVFELYLGGLLILVGLFMTMLDADIGVGWSLGIYTAAIAAAVAARHLAQKRIEQLHLGTARFGPARQRKVHKSHLAMAAGAACVAAIVVATVWFWRNPGAPFSVPMAMAALWSVQILLVFGALAHYRDQPLMLLYGFLLAGAVPMDLALREFAQIAVSYLTYGIPGLLIVALGAAMLRRFLRENPACDLEASHD